MALLARAPSLLHLQPLSIAAHAFLLPQTTPRPTLHCRPLSARVRASNSDPPQQVNLSRPPLHPRYLLLRAASARHRNWALGPTGFARFPLSYTRRGTIAGIPGLDESYLPRWIGLGFGALVLLNHLLSPSPTSAQLVGYCRTFTLLYSTGAGAASRVPLPEGSRQVFVIPDDLSAAQKEDMAWATYVLLQNTNTTSVLIAVGDVLCIRGYWDPPADIPKNDMIEWFKSQMEQAGLVNLSSALYLPSFSGEAWFELDQDGSRQTFP
ncbi:hypothetical protein ACQ4PT_016191 [Festuca glaucescens]